MLPLGERLNRYFGRSIQGLLGNDLASRFVVEVDYVRRELVLHDPKTFRYEGAGTSVQVSGKGWTFAEATIHPPGQLPLRGRFLVDTGAAEKTALFLNRPFAERHGLLELARNTAEDLTAGLSGPVHFRAARLDALELGELRIQSPTVALIRDDGGVLASSEFDGVLATGLLSRFRLFFDYSCNRIVFEPTERTRRPFAFGVSGLLLASAGENFDTVVVEAVAAGSPATEAGLQRGDVLVTVDGVAASSIPLARLLERTRMPGERLELSIRRGDIEFATTLTTEPIELP